MTTKTSAKVYTGVDRRNRMDRRSGLERRNLVRFESIGTDRRVQSYRRQEDSYWVSHSNQS